MISRKIFKLLKGRTDFKRFKKKKGERDRLPNDICGVHAYCPDAKFIKNVSKIPLNLSNKPHGHNLKSAATTFAMTAASVASDTYPVVISPSYQIPAAHGLLSPPMPRTIPPCFLDISYLDAGPRKLSLATPPSAHHRIGRCSGCLGAP